MTSRPHTESPAPRSRGDRPIPFVIGLPAATAAKVLDEAGYANLRWLQRQPELTRKIEHPEDLVVMQVPFPLPTTQESGEGGAPDANRSRRRRSGAASSEEDGDTGVASVLAIVTAEPTKVPRIIDLTEPEARLKCEQAGLLLVIDEVRRQAENGEELRVESQSPDPETEVPKGSYVRAKLGPQKIM